MTFSNYEFYIWLYRLRLTIQPSSSPLWPVFMYFFCFVGLSERHHSLQQLVIEDAETTTSQWEHIIEYFQSHGYPRYAMSLLAAQAVLLSLTAASSNILSISETSATESDFSSEFLTESSSRDMTSQYTSTDLLPGTAPSANGNV